jgi:hypothetical protein
VTYETKGGVVSEDDAIMQLVEKVREASEAAYRAAHISNSHNRTERGAGFLKMGQNLEEMAKIIIRFATRVLQ